MMAVVVSSAGECGRKPASSDTLRPLGMRRPRRRSTRQSATGTANSKHGGEASGAQQAHSDQGDDENNSQAKNGAKTAPQPSRRTALLFRAAQCLDRMQQQDEVGSAHVAANGHAARHSSDQAQPVNVAGKLQVDPTPVVVVAPSPGQQNLATDMHASVMVLVGPSVDEEAPCALPANNNPCPAATAQHTYTRAVEFAIPSVPYGHYSSPPPSSRRAAALMVQDGDKSPSSLFSPRANAPPPKRGQAQQAKLNQHEQLDPSHQSRDNPSDFHAHPISSTFLEQSPIEPSRANAGAGGHAGGISSTVVDLVTPLAVRDLIDRANMDGGQYRLNPTFSASPIITPQVLRMDVLRAPVSVSRASPLDATVLLSGSYQPTQSLLESTAPVTPSASYAGTPSRLLARELFPEKPPIATVPMSTSPVSSPRSSFSVTSEFTVMNLPTAQQLEDVRQLTPGKFAWRAEFQSPGPTIPMPAVSMPPLLFPAPAASPDASSRSAAAAAAAAGLPRSFSQEIATATRVLHFEEPAPAEPGLELNLNEAESEAAPNSTFSDPERRPVEPMPPFGGFSTAAGKQVHINPEALARARALFADSSEDATGRPLADSSAATSGHVPKFTGFTTASNKPVHIDPQALARARAMMGDADDAEEDEHEDAPAPAKFAGFTTASNKPVHIDPQALARARAMMGDADEAEEDEHDEAPQPSAPVKFAGFTTASNKPVHIDSEALAQARAMFAEQDAVQTNPMSPASFEGFSTASNRPMPVAPEALERARAKLSSSDTRPASPKLADLPPPPPASRGLPPNTSGFKTPILNRTLMTAMHQQQLPTAPATPVTGGRTLPPTPSSHRGGPASSPLLASGSRPFRPPARTSASSTPELSRAQSPTVVPLSMHTRLANKRVAGAMEGVETSAAFKKHCFVAPLLDPSAQSRIATASTSHHDKTNRASSLPSASSFALKSAVFHPALPAGQKPTPLRAWMLDPTPIPPTKAITAANASTFRFSAPEHMDLADVAGGFLPLTVSAYSGESGATHNVSLQLGTDGCAGAAEFELALRQVPGVKLSLIAGEWVANHFRWIVWKLASQDTRLHHVSRQRCLTPQRVMTQLRARYEYEVNHARRSALRRIHERDDVPTKFMVLCVAEILSGPGGAPQPNQSQRSETASPAAAAPTANGNPHKSSSAALGCSAKVLLTDSWYSIEAQLDRDLAALVQRGKIAVGTKLAIASAELVGPGDGAGPLEPGAAKTSLRLTANATRRARWWASLGYQGRPPFFTALSTASPTGGAIAAVDVVVLRQYPAVFIETVDGRKVIRSRRAEERALTLFEERLSRQVEQLQEKRLASHELLASNKEQHDDEADKDEEEDLQHGMGEFGTGLDANGILAKRDVTSLMKVRVMDTQRARALLAAGESESAMFALSTVISVWRPSEDLEHLLREGAHVAFYSLLPSSYRGASSSNGLASAALQVGTIRSTRYAELPAVPECATMLPRQFCDCSSIEALALGSEVDTVGVVVGRTVIPDRLFLADASEHMRLFVVQTSGGLDRLGVGDKLTRGTTVAISNALVQRFVRVSGSSHAVPVLEVSDLSVFSTKPGGALAVTTLGALQARIAAIPDPVSFNALMDMEVERIVAHEEEQESIRRQLRETTNSASASAMRMDVVPADVHVSKRMYDPSSSSSSSSSFLLHAAPDAEDERITSLYHMPAPNNAFRAPGQGRSTTTPTHPSASGGLVGRTRAGGSTSSVPRHTANILPRTQFGLSGSK
ncbi:hypothetical protein CAOG_04962 [Capsaspora owczarzaki ATCC 30864]|uniref:Uncharacterized protein n=1 Tax=Capsaspora owczarzaki (strain ATCC 30864) TaxID=595528 RepID=A0A0D2UGS7_CAPO3|nr:hypothetical protein CAOG_04962 [Capsaspora owczarzaki ATCC 30864]KJE94296.1 hypothetical protein CAOG_004962 [Capsaspora owczarzaki ATCC 30864]|eukprot:XP_004346647.2 hypothetical protein CAOG_04962 [Capsaspora owczarzaki ATCC 30864]